MSLKMLLFSAPFLAFVWAPVPVAAQDTSSQRKAQATVSQPQEGSGSSFLFKKYSRMVNVDVVVEDTKGNHIRGLTAGDFAIYEQTPSKSRQKREQKIVELREMEIAGMKAPAEVPTETAPGVYTNAVAAQKDPVPPTVLLVDGLNTEIQHQAQVHTQMLRMLKQLPPNVPVAVFLMGIHLEMLQGFTTDPRLLQAALAKAYSVTGQGLGHRDPKDDPSAAGSQLYGVSDRDGSVGEMIAHLQAFDQRVYAANLTERSDRTNNALLSVARSLAGYPGRKNVLWLSTSFPLTLNRFMKKSISEESHDDLDQNDLAYVNNWGQMKILNNALSAAKVAVYPVDIGGVRNLQVYSAADRPANPYMSSLSEVDTQRVSGAASREIETMNEEQDTMHAIADETGGKVCSGSNDLGRCIRDAMKDSSHFYEISYYPDSQDWNGEYRRIFLNVKGRGTHLSYRQGYYATNEGNPDPKVQEAEMQKDCGELLNATGIAFTARSQLADAAGQLKFSLEIDPSALTFTPDADGQQKIDVEVGVCTYDGKGWPQKLMAYPLHAGFDGKAYNTLIAGGRLRDSILVPGPMPAAVRLLVKDIASGKLGSIYIQTADKAGAPSQAAAKSAGAR